MLDTLNEVCEYAVKNVSASQTDYNYGIDKRINNLIKTCQYNLKITEIIYFDKEKFNEKEIKFIVERF